MTTLTAPQAARLCNMSVAQFRRAVQRGELPKPVLNTRPALWSRYQLDRVLRGEQESIGDTLMEEINGLSADEIR